MKVPLGFWRGGWIAVLSGAAVALLIILLDLQGTKAEHQWISPSQARLFFDLSADTWTKGHRELTAWGLLSVRKIQQSAVFDFRRLRNGYWVYEERLEEAVPTNAA